MDAQCLSLYFPLYFPNWMFEELGELLAILTIILLAEGLTADNRVER